MRIEGFLERMRRIRRRLGDKDIVFCMDANSKNPLWGGEELDARGEAMEGVMLELDLEAINDVRQGPTFVRVKRGVCEKSYIDLVLVTNSLCGRWKDWTLREDWSSSAHRVISFVITGERVGRNFEVRPIRWKLRSADWDEFRRELLATAKRLLEYRINGKVSVVKMEREVCRWIVEAARKHIGMSKGSRLGSRWWTAELDRLRREVLRRRKEFQRERDVEERRRKGAEWKRLRRRYRDEVELAKESSWKAFVGGEIENSPWNFVYKLAGRKVRPREVMQALGKGEEQRVSWVDSAKWLLEELLPWDYEQNESARQRRIRDEDGSWEKVRGRMIIDENMVRRAMGKLKKGKAPGHDGILGEFIMEGGEVMVKVLTRLFQACADYSVFPKVWKKGVIRTLLKGDDKDPELVKSYRPICLLPILGKVLERCIVEDLEEVFYGGVSRRQYGFMRGRSTEAAMEEVRRLVVNSRRKYVLGIFVDFEAAFDRVWWPGVLDRLRRRNVVGRIYALIRDYLCDRVVEMREGGRRVVRRVNRGCPQGSVLGPQMWKLVMDECLEGLEGINGISLLAYADDVVLIVEGDSRNVLEEKGNEVMGAISRWCEEAKMKVSAGKTVMMLLKGRLDRERPPRIRSGGDRLSCVEDVKYLGVRWERGWRINKHVDEVLAKGVVVMRKLGRYLRDFWGEKGVRRYMEVYRGVFIPIVSYAVGVWFSCISRSVLRKKLMKGQRALILAMIRGYRTMSTEGAVVLAGVWPLDLELERCWAKARLRMDGGVEWSGVRLVGRNPKAEIEKKMLELWQERWDVCETGRWTYRFLPRVEDRMKKDWFMPEYYVTQVLSGHGNFRAKLYQLGLAEDDMCRCGEVETVEHVLMECRRFQQRRSEFMVKCEEKLGVGDWDYCVLLRDVEIYDVFKNYVVELMRKREEEEYVDEGR